MKRVYMIFMLIFVMVFGINVQAAPAEETPAEETESKDGNTIIKQCQAVMGEKKVIAVEEYVTSAGMSIKILAVSMDANTKVFYMELLGTQMYIDGVNGLLYMRDSADGKWYVEQADAADMATMQTASNTSTTNYTITSPVYKETTNYRNVMCDVVDAVLNVNGTNYNATLYINEATHELCGCTVIEKTDTIEMVCLYPASVSIPAEIVANAVLAKGSSVKIDEVEYTAVKKGVEVTGGKKLTGTVTIPDSITFAGKQYAVTQIADKAFSGNKKITKITIGKNVKSIGKRAFYNCKKLKQVKIQSTKLTKIGQKAFYGNAKNLKVKAPKKKLSKYKGLIEKSGTKSKVVYSKL